MSDVRIFFLNRCFKRGRENTLQNNLRICIFNWPVATKHHFFVLELYYVIDDDDIGINK